MSGRRCFPRETSTMHWVRSEFSPCLAQTQLFLAPHPEPLPQYTKWSLMSYWWVSEPRIHHVPTPGCLNFASQLLLLIRFKKPTEPTVLCLWSHLLSFQWTLLPTWLWQSPKHRWSICSLHHPSTVSGASCCPYASSCPSDVGLPSPISHDYVLSANSTLILIHVLNLLAQYSTILKQNSIVSLTILIAFVIFFSFIYSIIYSFIHLLISICFMPI